MTKLDIEAARAICEKATEGPWKQLVPRGAVCMAHPPFVRVGIIPVDRNREFIAAARTLLPQALDELEQLRDGEQAYRDVMRETCEGSYATDTIHCTCVPHLRQGVQELSAELEQARKEVDRVRSENAVVHEQLEDAWKERNDALAASREMGWVNPDEMHQCPECGGLHPKSLRDPLPCGACQKLTQARAWIERARGYSIHHRPNCKTRTMAKSLGYSCTCGLDALMAELEGGE